MKPFFKNFDPIQMRGFVLVELMTVVALIGLLASITIPILSTMIETARHRQCDVTRNVIQAAEGDYNITNQGQANLKISSLFSSGYLNQNYQCPSEGRYVWVSPNAQHAQYPLLGCSTHYWPVSELRKTRQGRREINKQKRLDRRKARAAARAARKAAQAAKKAAKKK